MIPDPKLEFDAERREVLIAIDDITLEGTLVVPRDAKGIVLFAHGSGSSRHSPRNRYVAQILHTQGIATLLFDLLTRHEESMDQYTGELRFDIPFLAKRLVAATYWIANDASTRDLKVGYFGASTGAGAALVASAELPKVISAVVSRGGRPDLAGGALDLVRASTLLIVGGEDTAVIAMNREALTRIKCQDEQLAIIPGATHLFEEPGTLEEVAKLAAEWFGRHFTFVQKAQGASAKGS